MLLRLSDEQQLLLESLDELLARVVTPEYVARIDREHRPPLEFEEAMAEAGFSMLGVPEEFGGMGASTFDVYRVCELLARIDVGIATGVFATFLGSDPIVFGATDEQKEHWLSRLAEEGLLMAYGATEPEAGSDLGALRTTAKRVMDGDAISGYVINGTKQWISNGSYADLYTILAMAPDGPTWFVVDGDIEGFEKDLFSQNTEWVQLFPLLIIELHDWMLPREANSEIFLEL